MEWDHAYDVVVVGSGAGGLTAALTARLSGLSALVLEKTERFGGSTSLSGGAIWVPNNLYLERAGVRDSADDARRYLESTVGGRVPAERRDAYLARGPEMVRFLHERTRHVRFDHTPGYPDYYPEHPGGRPGGRSVEPRIVDARLLESQGATLRRAVLPTHGLTITSADFGKLTMVGRTWAGRRTAVKVGLRALRGLVTGARYLSLGEALVARLRLALADAGGELWLSTPLTDLVTDDGRVTGVRAAGDGGPRTIHARRGVVLAAGGFSHNQELRERYLPAPTSTDWTLAAPGQTGDALVAGMRAGAGVDLLERVWGAPSAPVPGGPPFFLVSDRGVPRMAIIDGDGERYVNEAAPYHEFVDTMYKRGAPAMRSWMIIDSRTRNRYVVLGLFPGQPFPKHWRWSGFVRTGDTPEELASAMGVPGPALRTTVREFNACARSGHDTRFGRGDSAYDNYYGDPTLPNPNLDPLDRPPYYAFPLVPGDIGTKGGLVTDTHARVLRDDGVPLTGLYATGNCSAAVMGESYPGPGATLGPAMTFGYVAARHAMGGER